TNRRPFFRLLQITKLKIDSNPFAKGFRDSSRLTDFERETMESMLAEQQTLRFPHRLPFEMEQLQTGAVNNLSLEEKALWAARSQMLLRAAAQQQHQQQQQLGHLWWASSIGSTIFAAAHHQQQLVASSSQQNATGPAAPRPLYPSPLALGHNRFSPYHTTVPKSSTPAAPSPSPSRRATPSPTDSLSREAQDLSPS
ncbi:T-box transcription factor TBX20, partial [Trachymyrmex cornetzi]